MTKLLFRLEICSKKCWSQRRKKDFLIGGGGGGGGGTVCKISFVVQDIYGTD